MSLTVLWTAGITAAVAVLLSAVARWLALKYKVVDVPKVARKIHKRPTALLGGAAVILAFFVGVALAWPHLIGGYMLPKHLIGLMIGACFVLVGGVLDDKFDLSPKLQIVFPVLAVLSVIVAGIGIDYITNPFGGVLQLDTFEVEVFSIAGMPYYFTILADLFTLAWLMGMMYTTKFLDGLDGLVSGVTVIGAVIIAVLSMTSIVYQPETAHLSLLAAAAFFGFLCLNWHPARIFLGESGALFAGFILGVLGIISGGKIATTLLILGIPILDVLWVIIRRLFLEKRSPFKGDRKHLHLRLIDIGLSQRQAVLVLYAFTTIFGVSSLFLQSRSKVAALAVMGVTMLVLGAVIVRQYRRRQKELKEKS
ncbi:glycosyltransferase family 4 protein [Patescibacteria group bacterium]